MIVDTKLEKSGLKSHETTRRTGFLLSSRDLCIVIEYCSETIVYALPLDHLTESKFTLLGSNSVHLKGLPAAFHPFLNASNVRVFQHIEITTKSPPVPTFLASKMSK